VVTAEVVSLSAPRPQKRRKCILWNWIPSSATCKIKCWIYKLTQESERQDICHLIFFIKDQGKQKRVSYFILSGWKNTRKAFWRQDSSGDRLSTHLYLQTWNSLLHLSLYNACLDHSQQLSKSITLLALLKSPKCTVTEIVLVATDSSQPLYNFAWQIHFLRLCAAKHHGKWSKTMACAMWTPLELQSPAEGSHASPNTPCYTLSRQICSDKLLQHWSWVSEATSLRSQATAEPPHTFQCCRNTAMLITYFSIRLMTSSIRLLNACLG